LATLYVVSSIAGAGKTMICAGLGRHFLNESKKTGFLKPILAQDGSPEEGADEDALFLKQVLALDEPLDYLCPVFRDGANLENKIREALTKVAAGKDVVIVEGGDKLDSTSLEIAQGLDARVIIIEGYSGGLSPDGLTRKYKDFEKYLLGVVVNKVPVKELPTLKSELLSKAGKAGINILGVLPEDRILLSLTVGELAKYTRGEILNDADKSAELVENLMLGAMNVGSGVEYFDLKTGKAAVIRIERPDIQMAALETQTKCLILSGSAEPMPTVLNRARVKGVPIIRVKDDIATIVTRIEAVLGKTKFGQEKKLPQLTQLLERHLDFQAIYQGLGL